MNVVGNLDNPISPEDLKQNLFKAFPDGQDMDPSEIPQEGYVKNGFRHFPDGSVIVDEPDNHGLPAPISEFHEQNLAEFLDDGVLTQIGAHLKRAIEEDQESQQQYYQNIATLIEQLGFTPDKLSAGGSDGEVGVTSPAVFETWLHFIATIMAAIFPSKAPVDCVIVGESTPELENIATRVSNFFSNYLQRVDKGFRKELQRTIAWSVFDSVYSKVFIDPILGRPTHRMIKPEDFIVNRDLSSHLAASRKTQVHHMDERELHIRQMIGEYKKIDMISNYGGEEGHVIRDELDQISGFDRANSRNSNFSKKYELWECHCDYRIPEDPKAGKFDISLPYIITLEGSSGKILRIQRNWDKEDFLKKHQEYFVNWSLFPSLDGEGYGLAQTANNASQSATLILRQLVQAGLYSNFPGGVYQAGLRLENNSLRPRPGEFLPLQTGGMPIDQSIKPLPYQQPSPALMDLKNQIEDSIRKPSAIVNDAMTEMAPRAPAASVLAMLENFQVVPNFVLQGYYKSFEEMLELFRARFIDWLPADKPYPFKVPGGSHVIMRSDFADHLQVIPSADPSLQNSMYRLMRAEIILNNARQNPELHDLRYANEMFYKSLNVSIDEIDKLVVPKEDDAPGPQPLDPITENQNLIQGKGVKAGIDQDHDAHILVHSSLEQNAIAQGNPDILAAITAHKAEHTALKMLVDFQMQTGQEMPTDPSQLPVEIQNQIAVMAAHAISQQQQAAQQQTPPDPALIQAQAMADEVRVSELEVNQKSENDKLKLMLDQSRLEFDRERVINEINYKERDLEYTREKTLNEQRIKEKELELKMLEAQAKLKMDQAKLDQTQEQHYMQHIQHDNVDNVDNVDQESQQFSKEVPNLLGQEDNEEPQDNNEVLNSLMDAHDKMQKNN